MAVVDAYLPMAIVFIILNTIVVGLRTSTRISMNTFGYDDAVMIVAMVGFALFTAVLLRAIHFGLGAEDVKSYYDGILAAKFFTIAQIVYIISSGVAKIAVALVLFRLTTRTQMPAVRYVLIAVMAITSIFTIFMTFIFCFQCRPIERAWGGTTSGKCMSTASIGNLALALSIEDVAVSWVCALLPIYMLWKAHMPRKVKATVIILLGLGAVTSIFTIIRLKYIVVIQKLSGTGGLSAANSISLSVQASVYSYLEISLSILAASLAALRPLLRKVGILDSTGASGSGSAKPSGSYHLRTIGQVSSCGPGRGAINLSDGEDTDSQRRIIGSEQWNKKQSGSAQQDRE